MAIMVETVRGIYKAKDGQQNTAYHFDFALLLFLALPLALLRFCAPPSSCKKISKHIFLVRNISDAPRDRFCLATTYIAIIVRVIVGLCHLAFHIVIAFQGLESLLPELSSGLLVHVFHGLA